MKCTDDHLFAVAGYRYGSTLVPFAQEDKDAMKFGTEKCFKVLGFTKSENVSFNIFSEPTHCKRVLYSKTYLLCCPYSETECLEIR